MVNDEHRVQFGTLRPDGSYEPKGSVRQSDMLRCPRVIMVLEHYRADGSCRCDDPTHTEMVEWGFTWNANAGRWE
jgi:hypothetical protein